MTVDFRPEGRFADLFPPVAPSVETDPEPAPPTLPVERVTPDGAPLIPVPKRRLEPAPEPKPRAKRARRAQPAPVDEPLIHPEPAEGRRIGYARVSTDEQTTDLQRDALKKAGCETMYCEQGVSGSTKSHERPAFGDLMKELRPGDTLVVWRLDRLGRSLTDLVATVERLHKKGIMFLSLSERIDTTNAAGKMIFHVFCTMAQFERDLISERTRAGLAATKARGTTLGRRRKVNPEQEAQALDMYAQGIPMQDIAKAFDVKYHTIWRLCRDSKGATVPYVDARRTENRTTEA